MSSLIPHDYRYKISSPTPVDKEPLYHIFTNKIKKVVRSRAHFLILKSSYSQSNYKSIILNYSKLNSIAAFTKSRNKGCGFCGRDKNSGWNCPATNQRCPGISIISTNPV